MGISAPKTKIISEYEFKYGSSDNVVNLRKIYGNDGYKKYVAKPYILEYNHVRKLVKNICPYETDILARANF